MSDGWEAAGKIRGIGRDESQASHLGHWITRRGKAAIEIYLRMGRVN